MVNTDLLSDLIARIKNGYMAHRKTIDVRWSKTAMAVAEELAAHKYIAGVKKTEGGMEVELKYTGREAALADIGRVSTPGARVYVGYKNIPRVWGGAGMHIVSTPKGVMSDKQAKKMKLGGEVICFVR